ncbi:MAG: cytochrome P450 [Deltaproteobacteria bacterium]|nr:cytochrome P450 [Deltaproteobacteria bacterium]MBW2418041.1 cytochrome P450 [Deltaproteobacteria bacterium]
MSSASDSSAPIEIDLTDPAIKKDPWPTLRRLREEDPIHYLDFMDGWLVTRYDDVKALHVDPRVTGDQRVWQHYKPPAEGTFQHWIDNYGLMAVSGKDHARQRHLLAHGFTPRGVARMDAQIREVVKHYAEPLKGRSGVIDIMKEFTTPIPAAVISTITGVAADGVAQERFSRLSQEVVQGFFGFVSDEVIERSERSYIELASWVRETVRKRRENPEEDLISDLVEARHGEHKFSDEDIVAQVSALVAAGSETTATGGVLSIMTLLDHPEALEEVRRDRSLIPQTVHEILRLAFGGIFGTRRFAVDDFELKGRKIRKGQMLVLSLGGASHDPARYPDPERFDVHRNPQDLLTFGSGAHYCLGANLAKGELYCMVDAALDFLPPGARVLKEQIEVQSLGMFDRTMTCPVDFGGGAS